MKPTALDADKLTEEGPAPERGHTAWKDAKVRRGLEQAKRRGEMIPAEQVWRDLGLDR